MEYISNNEKETAKIATDFVGELKLNKDRATTVGLYGDLGAGKTTFMKYVAEALGVQETIQSPTFVIMKKYSLKGASKKAQVKKLSNFILSNFQTILHIDAYRIDEDKEMLNLGWQEMISDPKNLIFIEWPERIGKIMPKHIVVKFEHGREEKQRKISIA